MKLKLVNFIRDLATICIIIFSSMVCDILQVHSSLWMEPMRMTIITPIPYSSSCNITPAYTTVATSVSSCHGVSDCGTAMCKSWSEAPEPRYIGMQFSKCSKDISMSEIIVGLYVTSGILLHVCVISAVITKMWRRFIWVYNISYCLTSLLIVALRITQVIHYKNVGSMSLWFIVAQILLISAQFIQLIIFLHQQFRHKHFTQEYDILDSRAE